LTAAVKLYRDERRPFQPQHARILALLVGGLTDEELVLKADVSPSGARGRRSELVKMGLVENSGTFRRTGRGRKAAVWRPTSAGLRKLREMSHG
jgi:predicted ArsR family transcriptional regulator